MTKTAKFTISVEHDEETHDEPPKHDLHCFSSSLLSLNMIQLENQSAVGAGGLGPVVQN